MSARHSENAWIGRIMAIGSMPDEQLRTRLLEEAHAELEREGPRQVLPFALLSLTASYLASAEATRAPLTFTQALRLFDDEPELFDAADRNWLMVGYRNMIGLLIGSPQVSAAQIDQAIADMSARVAASGHGWGALRMGEFAWAAHREHEDTEDRFRAWRTQSIDDTSGCEWCNATITADHLDFTDRRAEGIALLQATLARSPQCDSEPDDMLAQLAIRYLRTGELDLARSTYRRAHLAASSRGVATAYSVKARALFLAYSDAPGPCLVALREVAKDLAAHPDPPIRRLDRLNGLVRVARAWMTAGHTDLVVDLPDVPATNPQDLHDWAFAQALDLAAQFDARNGDETVTRNVTRVSTEECEIVPLDITISVPGVDLPTSAQREFGTTGAEVFTRAGYLSRRDETRAVQAYLRAARLFEAEGDFERAGFSHAEAGHLCEVLGDATQGRAQYIAALDLLRRATVPLTACAPIAAALIDCLRELDLYDEGLAHAAGWLAALSADTTPAARVEWCRLAWAEAELSLAAQLPSAAIERFDQIAWVQADLGDPRRALEAAFRSGVTSHEAGDQAAALRALEYAWGLADRLGVRDRRRDLAGALIAVLRALGDEVGAQHVLAQTTAPPGGPSLATDFDREIDDDTAGDGRGP